MISLSIIILEDSLITAICPIRFKRPQISEGSCRWVTDCYPSMCLFIIRTFNMHPHYKLTGFLIIDNLRTLYYLRRVKIWSRIIIYRRQNLTLKFPVCQILGWIASHPSSFSPPALPGFNPVQAIGGITFKFTIPIISTFMVENTSSMCIYRISIHIFPDTAGSHDIFSLLLSRHPIHRSDCNRCSFHPLCWNIQGYLTRISIRLQYSHCFTFKSFRW